MNTNEFLKLLSFQPEWKAPAIEVMPSESMILELYVRKVITLKELIRFSKRLNKSEMEKVQR